MSVPEALTRLAQQDAFRVVSPVPQSVYTFLAIQICNVYALGCIQPHELSCYFLPELKHRLTVIFVDFQDTVTTVSDHP